MRDQPVKVTQQRDVDERARIYTRPVVDSDYPFRCPTAAEVTSALVMPGPQDWRDSWPRQRSRRLRRRRDRIS
jgi:hypothetical protein